MVTSGEEQKESRGIVLSDKKCIVKKVQVTGLKRTKGDFIMDDLKPVLNSPTFVSVYARSLECKMKLMNRGIFEDVEIVLDTTRPGKRQSYKEIQVLFRVKEKKRLTGGVKTEMSTNDSPEWVLRFQSPNILGRGENITASFSRKLNSDVTSQSFYQPCNFNFSLTKPYRNQSEVRFSLLKNKQDCPWNAASLTTRGAELEYKFPIGGSVHTIAWNGHLREVSRLNRNMAFSICEELGHTSKSTLIHSVTMDRRDDSILPSKGYFLKITEELAGLGCSTKMIKEIVEAQLTKTFFNSITLSSALQAGIAIPLSSEKIGLPDRFFIGGPLTLRGFEMYCAGPQSQGHFVGGNSYWLAGVHAYLPLPFYRKHFGSWIDGFRIHGFFNAGNLMSFVKCESLQSQLPQLIENIRASYGIGLVYNFMHRARIELNFCFPFLANTGDRLCDGMQFGIGINSV